MRIAIASFGDVPSEFTDDGWLVSLLRNRGAEASIEDWHDDGVDWRAFDLVVVRSTWDYARRRDRFLAWAENVGDRLHNPPALLRWNSDKRYLGELGDAGFAVVDTRYVEPGEPPPEIDGEVVIKPAISVGGRDTGRFAPEQAAEAHALIAAIGSSRRTAMVQPYRASVDTDGETAIVFVDGEPSHALRKRAVLRPGEVAPVRDDALGVAEAMYDAELVLAATATDDELALAHAVVAEVGRRFGGPPLYARVDQVRGPAGSPELLELEAVEPSLYLEQAPGAAERLADAIIARANGVLG